LAQALVHDPDILILDEPLSGLDPAGTQEVINLLIELRKRNKTILISSHLLSRVEEICDRVAILHKGRLIKEGPLSELLESESPNQTLEVSGIESKEDLNKLVQRLQDENVKVESFGNVKRPLDEVFLDIVAEDKEGNQ
jgi:ABC-2 type transport system ATP-binding protein